MAPTSGLRYNTPLAEETLYLPTSLFAPAEQYIYRKRPAPPLALQRSAM